MPNMMRKWPDRILATIVTFARSPIALTTVLSPVVHRTPFLRSLCSSLANYIHQSERSKSASWVPETAHAKRMLKLKNTILAEQ